MAQVLLSALNSRDGELKMNIQIYNETTNHQIKTEMVHAVYDLGYDELAEAMTDAIYGQTNNLKYLLGEDFTVTDENNYAKPTFLQDWFRSAVKLFSFIF